MIKTKKNEFFIGGRHAVLEIIKNRDKSIHSIICTKNKFEEISKLLKKKNKQIKDQVKWKKIRCIRQLFVLLDHS